MKSFSSLNLSFLLALCVTVVGQSQLHAATADTTELQQQLVEQRIASLQEQGETSEESATLRAYQETLNWLRETESYDLLATQFQQELVAAPQDEAAIRSRMADASQKSMPLQATDLQLLDWPKLNDKSTELRSSLTRLINRRDSLEQQISSESGSTENIRARLSAIDREELAMPASQARFETGGTPSQFEASQWQLSAHRRALVAERHALNTQLSSQPLRNRKIRTEREELVQSIEALQADLNTVEQSLALIRPAIADQAMDDVKPGAPGYALLKDMVAENLNLTEQRTILTATVTDAGAEKTRTDNQLFRLMEEFDTARRLVDSGGRSTVYGPFLMNYYMQLDQHRPPQSRLRQSNTIGEIVINRARHEQQLAELLNTNQYLTNQIELLETARDIPGSVLDTAQMLVLERKDLLTDLMSTESELVQLLGKLDIGYEQADSLVKEFETFLIGHILWIRSHLPINRDSLKQLLPDSKRAFASLNASRYFQFKPYALLALAVGLLLLLLRRRMWQRMEEINKCIERPRDDSIIYSIGMFVLTLIRSAAVPLIMVGLALSIEDSATGFLQPFALSLIMGSSGVMMALFLRDATSQGGICPAHFNWPESRCINVRTMMTWALMRLLPIALIASFLVQLEQNLPHAILGRFFLCMVAIMLALKALRMVKRQVKGGSESPAWLQNTLVISLTLFLMFIVLSGFLLPARIIYYSLAASFLTFVCLLFIHEFMMRWLLVTRRRLRFERLLATLPESGGAKGIIEGGLDRSDEDSVEDRANIEARRTKLSDLSDSTSQLVKALIYALGGISIIMIWAPLLPAIQGLQQFTLWAVSQNVNGVQVQTQITLATIVLAIIIFVTTFYLAKRLPSLIELVMRSTGKSSPATRYTVSTITNYIIIAIGTMVFFSTLKMSWSQLQWLVAALGVGIGFGLQEIVANFISGLIILFERPIRVGDVVTVGDSSGTVTKIQIRATTIRDWDGKELLVPNKEFITGRLLNWTLSDTTNRMVVDVGIAYGSDVNQAMAVLQKVVSENPAILSEPSPNILFTKFGDNALQLSVRCFLASLDDRLKRMSELHTQIYNAFSDAGIVIAFPQIDVHLDPNSPLTVRLQEDSLKPHLT